MRRMTIRGIFLQLDDLHSGTDAATLARLAREHVEAINLSLQREPYGLAAQVGIDDLQVAVEPLDEDEPVVGDMPFHA